MQSFHSTQYSCQHITYSQIIVIVRVKIKVKVWITLLHFTHEFDNLQGIENSQGVRKHETTDTVFQIQIDFKPSFVRIVYRIPYVGQMFLQSLLQLIAAMLFRSLRKQVDYLSSCIMNPVDRHLSVNESQDFYPLQ